MRQSDSLVKVYRATPMELVRQAPDYIGVSPAGRPAAWQVSNPVGPRGFVKTGVFWLPAAGFIVPEPNPSSLWIAGCETAIDRGPGGESGPLIPVSDFFGTQAAPVAIPANAALFGQFLTVSTALAGIRGEWTAPNSSRIGSWWVHANWWAVADICDDEWREMKRDMRLTLEEGSFLPTDGFT